MNKLRSRKLIATVVTGLLVVLNTKLNLGLSQELVNAIVLLVVAYVASQAFVDGKEALPDKTTPMILLGTDTRLYTSGAPADTGKSPTP